MTNPAIVFEDVSIDFPIYDSSRSFRSALKTSVGGFIHADDATGGRTSVRALDGVNLTIEAGDRVGLIGHNGAGKSTMLQAVSGGYFPSQGHIHVHGQVSSLLNMGFGIDPEETGYANIMRACLYLGLDRRTIRALVPDIAEFCDLGDFLYVPVRTYSSGMSVRLSFAIATALRPDILVIDEIIGAGDAKFAKRAHARISKLMRNAHTLILASHATETILNFCNKGLYLEAGAVKFYGDVQDAIKAYEDA